MPIIDFHSHFIVPELLDACGRHSVQTGFGIRPFPVAGDPSGKGRIYSQMADIGAHIEWMNASGIDICVISQSTVLQSTAWADAAEDLSMCQIANRFAAEFSNRQPDRFIGSFTLPLQNIELSLLELKNAKDSLGLKVANFPAKVGGDYVGDSRFDPVWEALESTGTPVYIHPHGVTDLWFQKFRMWNSIGQSIEEAKVMTSLIYEGVLEKFPHLKIVMAHGGGYFPHYLGRLDRNVTNYPESAKYIRDKPSAYLKRFYYDSCVYDPTVIEVLVKVVGADRLVMGSDFPVGEPDPVAFLKSCKAIGKDELPGVLGDTAAHLIGI
ncbi:amidohydrolase family protein [Paraburkholderia nemoris]|uniref:amidohydrolase family protein n=1 Tax=Paraburkholderia nemoris TaxID=2793076 RepID=UPI0038B7DAD8